MNIILKRTLFFIALLILFSCDALNDDFFEKLLQDKDFSARRLCGQTPPILSDGDTFEAYLLKSDVIDRFIKRSIDNTNLDFPDIYSMSPYGNYDTCTPWRRCTINNHRLIEALDYLKTSKLNMKCFTIEELIQVSSNGDNYYSLFFDLDSYSIVSYQLFIIELKTQKLYHISIHMV